jgi:hypothetical protein
MNNNNINIAFLLDQRRIYRWHLWLADALRNKGVKVFFFMSSKAGLSSALTLSLLLGADRLINRSSSKQNASDIISPLRLQGQNRLIPLGELDNNDDETCIYDAIINFTEKAEPDAGLCRILTPVFNGIAGDAGLLDALIDRKKIIIHIIDSKYEDKIWQARPVVENGDNLTRSLDNILSRACEFIFMAINETGSPASLVKRNNISFLMDAKLRLRQKKLAGAIINNFTGKIKRKLKRQSHREENKWMVAWRLTDDAGLAASAQERTARFNILADDGERYLADPFIWRAGNLYHIFLEEYPYDTEKGVISVLTIDEAGNISAPPRRALERPYHLSYPHILEHDGEIWMIPEAGASGRVEIYRATNFPYEWEFAGALLEGIGGNDATICRHDGRLWMFMTSFYRQSTSWDNLLVYHAENLLGPWRAHERNPLLIDGVASRPGGEMFTQEGELFRPVQDCRNFYGEGLTIYRVDKLTPNDFAQSATGDITVSSPSSIIGVHTINRLGRLEVVDLFGAPPEGPDKTVELTFRPVTGQSG